MAMTEYDTKFATMAPLIVRLCSQGEVGTWHTCGTSTFALSLYQHVVSKIYALIESKGFFLSNWQIDFIFFQIDNGIIIC